MHNFMKNENMGLVYAEVELINGDDLAMVRRNMMDMDEVKRVHVTMLVDTGCYMLAINEHIKEMLNLPVIEKRRGQLADGSIGEYDVVGPVEVHFKNRKTSCLAMVLPGDSEPLLGAIPLEDMDVLIHPKRQELMVHPDHPDIAVMKMK